MFNKRRFKPVSRKMISLGLAAAMLMSVPGQSMLSYAMNNQGGQEQDVQEQSIESESGYRLYADELTSASGSVKGDITEVLPGYEIIKVKLPDGSLVEPEEVNFPVTESGDYVFEVIYNTASDVAGQAKVAETQATTVQSADAQSAGGQASEQGTEEQSTSDVLPESAGDTESEELTLTVTLPEEEVAEEAETEETAEPAPEETQSTESESQEITSRNSVAASLQSNSNVSTRAGGFSSTGWATSDKTWAVTDFTTKYGYYSNGHMNYSSIPSGDTILSVPLNPSYDNEKGVQFTFGGQMGTETRQAYWIQQGAAFSDITFDFTKDFALEGYMRIGDAFGCSGTTSPANTNMQIDGGVTISFIPTNQINASRANAALEKGGAYRLGAYGTLPNSIVCEFDTSTETYYNIETNGRNFVINKADVERTGDYYYSSNSTAHAWNSLAGLNIYDEANNNGMKNGTHIGISTTASDGYVPANISTGRAAYTSDRILLGSSDTGIIPYQIIYNSNSQTLTFTVKEAYDDQDYRTISYNLTEYFKRQTNKNLNLAFTYGAAYINLNTFVQTNNNPYFTGNRTGQIDIWAKEMYAVPDLKAGTTEVRWLSNAYEKAGASTEKNAYYNGTSYDYTDKATWPVAGDRIYIQNNFTPRTSLDPPTTSIQSGSLALSVENLAIKNTSDQSIGLSPPVAKLYYRLGENGDWQEYTRAITVSGSQAVYIRIEMTLPQLNDNSTEQYNVTGNIKGVYTVGNSKVTHTLDLMTANGKNITVSRNPMYIGFNGQDYYNSVRVIKSTEGITQLKNISNGGSKDAANSGDKTSLHYGSGYRPMSTGTSTASGDYYPMYQDRSGNGSGTYDLKKVDLQSASMDNLSAVTTETDIVLNKTYDVDKSKDTRYILTYLIEDGTYSNKSSALTQNTNRGKSTGTRVLWTSDNVTVQNGYEFYMEPSVTMTMGDFEGYDSVTNKASYYQKIAKAAGAAVFRTADADWTDLSASLTGTGVHTGIENALKNPGTAYDVTIRYTSGSTIVDKTVKLTIAEDVKKVTLEDDTTNNDAVNSDYTKVLVTTGENHTFNVTAAFKYNDTPEKFEEIKEENKLFAALYQQDSSSNGDADGTGDFSFVKGSSNVTSPLAASSLVSAPVISALNETDKTFTVTFTVTDDTNLTTADGYSSYNHKDYQIVAWTSANGSNSFTDADAAASLGDTQDDTAVPQARSKIYVQKPIVVTSGYESQTEKFYEDTGNFTTSFDYDTRSEFTGSSDTVNYAIYRVQGGDNALGICEAGTISLENGDVNRVMDNGFYRNIDNVTSMLDKGQGKIQLNITLNSNEGRTRSTYKVYVWNESNGNANVLSNGNNISETYKRNDDVLIGYPLSETTVLKIPKVYTSSTTDISQRTTNKMFYAGDPLTISATFTLEGGKTSDNIGDSKETISNLLTDLENCGELKIALYKVNPSGEGVEGYQMFALAQSNADENSLEVVFKKDTIGTVNITPSGNTGFTVTFTKASGDYQWDDGASYYIYAWTGANVDSLPGNFGTGGDNTIVADDDITTANISIPSVKTSMLGILTDEHFGEIIHYPKQIAMMDNVKPDNKHIFSANQKITMTPLKVEEEGQRVDAEVPDPDSGVDVVIKEISDSQDVENSIQVSRTVGSGDETIKLTCFLGTIEPGNAPKIGTNGKVGTLYFADQKNELPLYFRSSGSTPPDVADGAPFTGQIHFVFSKSASGN